MPKSAELLKANVFNSFCAERVTKAFLIELRIVTRFWYRPHIDNLPYVVCL